MEVVYTRCCGLDVHKKVVVACLITPEAKGGPHKEIRSFGTMTADLLELTRYHSSLVRERTAEVNRLQKSLEGANIKLASVASDIMGKSGREMLEALVGGATNSAELAELARGRLSTTVALQREIFCSWSRRLPGVAEP